MTSAEIRQNKDNSNPISKHQLKVINNIDLSDVPHSQKEKVREVSREEEDVFSQDDQYLGDVLEPSMKIKLKDDIPVQKNYNIIPKQFHSSINPFMTEAVSI